MEVNPFAKKDVRCAADRRARARGPGWGAGHGAGCPGRLLSLALPLTRESFSLSRRSFRSRPGEKADFCSASRPCPPLFWRVRATLRSAACTFFWFQFRMVGVVASEMANSIKGDGKFAHLFSTTIANLLLQNCKNTNRTINYSGVAVICKVKS